jgi:uracil-DNA glycosylase
MNLSLEEGWKSRLSPCFNSSWFIRLAEFVNAEYEEGICYPASDQIFASFNHCPFEQVKVVLIGQDPYHGPEQANGLCFSVKPGVRVPPSLSNIYKEVKADTGRPIPTSGDLTRWADQGVLLLNAVLTVRAGAPGSHQKRGWEQYTDEVIRLLNKESEHLVFLLWGAYAQKKGALIDSNRHLLLQSAHPSPLSAHNGFFGNRHFSQANAYLESVGKGPIAW